MTPFGRRLKIVALTFMLAVAGTGLLLYLQIRTQLEASSHNFSRVEPGLYIGGRVDAPPPDAHAVLNLTESTDSYTAAVYRWQPIPDAAPAPSLEWLRQQVQFIDEQRRSGRAVFVHCDSGLSRSGLVAAAYLMWHNHWGQEQALRYLREKRPLVHPNSAFRGLLTQWQKLLESSAQELRPLP